MRSRPKMSSSAASSRPARRSRAIASAIESSRIPSRADRSRRRSARTRPRASARFTSWKYSEKAEMTASTAPTSSPSSSASTRARSVRVVAAPEVDGRTSESLDQVEDLLAGLLRDDLAEERAEEPDLERQGVARAGRSDARRLRASRRAVPVSVRPVPSRRGPGGAFGWPRPQPSEDATATFLSRNRSYPCIVTTMAADRTTLRNARPPGSAGRKRASGEAARGAWRAERTGPDVRARPARSAAVHPRRRAPGHDRAHLGRVARDGRRRDARRPPCRCLLALPARPGRSVPDAGRDQRPRPLPDRPGARPVRRRRDRLRGGPSRAADDPRRQGRSPFPVGPRSRPAPLRDLHAQRAALLARSDRRRAQRPDRSSAASSARRTSPS